MMSDNIQALVRSRLEQADDALNVARILLNNTAGVLPSTALTMLLP
jgi:hypothetical protein